MGMVFKTDFIKFSFPACESVSPHAMILLVRLRSVLAPGGWMDGVSFMGLGSGLQARIGEFPTIQSSVHGIHCGRNPEAMGEISGLFRARNFKRGIKFVGNITSKHFDL